MSLLNELQQQRPGVPPVATLACCLCGKKAGPRTVVYVLDAEWERRYPQMNGRIACRTCALGNRYYWDCEGNPAGHIPASGSTGCIDSRSHIIMEGTVTAIAYLEPVAAAAQGASEYVRWRTSRRVAKAGAAAAGTLRKWERANQSPSGQERLIADPERLWRQARDLAEALDNLLVCTEGRT